MTYEPYQPIAVRRVDRAGRWRCSSCGGVVAADEAKCPFCPVHLVDDDQPPQPYRSHWYFLDVVLMWGVVGFIGYQCWMLAQFYGGYAGIMVATALGVVVSAPLICLWMYRRYLRSNPSVFALGRDIVYLYSLLIGVIVLPIAAFVWIMFSTTRWWGAPLAIAVAFTLGEIAVYVFVPWSRVFRSPIRAYWAANAKPTSPPRYLRTWFTTMLVVIIPFTLSSWGRTHLPPPYSSVSAFAFLLWMFTYNGYSSIRRRRTTTASN